MLKAEALIVIDPTMDNSDETINIKYKISLQSQRILSVQYSGYSYVKDAPYTLNLFYTANIDIKKGSKLTLKDFANIDDNLVNIYRNFKVEDSEINQASAGALEYILNTYTEADLIRYFEGADSSFKNSAFTFSYLTKVAIGISIEVPNGVGDHMEIELKYDDIIDNIKTENDIWKDLLQ
jgi:citrate lyase gamma subunit